MPPSTSPPDRRPPISPHLALAVAAVLPGCGHVLIGEQRRGATFLFFTLLLGAVTWQLTTPEQSLVGRYAGGLFVHALSLTDAYRLARLRYERWRLAGQDSRA